MSSSVPTVDSILESFPTNPLTKIHGRPTYDTLNELRNELKSNASSIPTSRGGGGHGYLGLILSADDYNNAVGQPFDPPVCPAASAEPSCRCHRRPNRRSKPPTCRKRSRMARIQQHSSRPPKTTPQCRRRCLRFRHQESAHRLQQPLRPRYFEALVHVLRQDSTLACVPKCAGFIQTLGCQHAF
jgi:hypothetical protein